LVAGSSRPAGARRALVTGWLRRGSLAGAHVSQGVSDRGIPDFTQDQV